MRPSTRTDGLITVAVAQTDPRFGSRKRNLRAILAAVRQAVEARVDLLVLPELCTTGYLSNRSDALAAAECLGTSPTLQAVTPLLAGTGTVAVLGMCVLEGAGVYDSAVALSEDGVLACYHKTHLWGRENEVFDAGDRLIVTADTRFGKIALLVCFDMWFPEAVRLLAMQDVDIVAVPANWDISEGRYFDDDMRTGIMAAQAHMNDVVVVCADRFGKDAGVAFAGRSVICEPRGILAGPLGANSAGFLTAEVGLAAVRRRRARGHKRSRRGDLYRLSLNSAEG
jgi:predicted amidohydrolase